jgi:hypothetical protein
VHYNPERGDWVAEAECGLCGGYDVDLRVHDPERWSLAHARAEAFVRRVHSTRCLGCHAESQRRRPRRAEFEPYLWWDTATHEWMAWLSVGGSPDGGVTLPLGIRSVWALPEARAALSVMQRGLPLPLRVAACRSEVDPHLSAFFHDADSKRWVLWVACEQCGGTELRLGAVGPGAVDAAADEACACIERMAADGCPHCRSEREWAAWVIRDDAPRLWYDTRTGEWVVWQAVDGTIDGVTLPLGLTRYDADMSTLFRLASDAVVGDWKFEEDGLAG